MDDAARLEEVKRLITQDRAQGVESLLRGVGANTARIIGKSMEGGEISAAEAEHLFTLQDTADIAALAVAADEIRKQDVGDVVTYVVNRNINFTNICYTYCGFCNFMAPEGDERAYFLTMDEIAAKTTEAWDRGATEVCMQGGMHPDIDGHFYIEIIKTVKRAVPGMHTHCFSPFEIYYGAKTIDESEENFIEMLKDVGHDTFPGTAAEVLDDEIRKIIAPGKMRTDKWISIVKKAHRAGVRTTSTIMYGHVDKPVHWAKHLEILRDIQKETGGITEFVPLRFIPWNTRIYKKGVARGGPTDLDQLKMYAVSRLMLRGWINNIQVSWVKQGPEFAQFCLTTGANDFGGTLMEEQISRAAGANHGQYFPPEEFRRLTRELARIPAERSTTYKILKMFDGEEKVAQSSRDLKVVPAVSEVV
ncbi:MAG: 5-amino-6-(D-ribitylamino)uracil--L-tyrosine 4-hydroxyphenyl transferase CofH [Candidatus Dadabacteria bacterium]|nr:5-amino-6-(D-ribitylamino)uracil--L-tyrosine 4-hydroxyphenyl transferase CofH [Candidatus Dadabacteria bacterium]